MATRSRIGIEFNDGSILSAYHHWDGYPDWLGKVLRRSIIRRRKFPHIDGGDMSCCWSDSIWGKNLPEGKHAPEYYSARGEDCPPRYDKDMEEFFSDGEEYSYIFRNGNWFAYDMHQFEDNVAPEPVEILLKHLQYDRNNLTVIILLGVVYVLFNLVDDESHESLQPT